MNKHDENNLRLMLDAAREARSFAAGKSKNDLNDNRMLVLSLAKAIETLAGIAAKVSDEGRRECPGIPWTAIINTGSLLTNSYFYINLDAGWRTVTEELPPAIAELERAVPPSDVK